MLNFETDGHFSADSDNCTFTVPPMDKSMYTVNIKSTDDAVSGEKAYFKVSGLCGNNEISPFVAKLYIDVRYDNNKVIEKLDNYLK